MRSDHIQLLVAVIVSIPLIFARLFRTRSIEQKEIPELISSLSGSFLLLGLSIRILTDTDLFDKIESESAGAIITVTTIQVYSTVSGIVPDVIYGFEALKGFRNKLLTQNTDKDNEDSPED
jgi:hypothetical protein